MKNKKIVAVLFGGISPEHDVSILTGLQVIEAMDSSLYDAIPIYVDKEGIWFSGKELLSRKNYHFTEETKKKLVRVRLEIGNGFAGKPKNVTRCFNVVNSSLFSTEKKILFDIAFLAFHGGAGENGQMQSLLDLANIPYTGPRFFSSAVFMNKSISKAVFKEAGIKVLPEFILKTPSIVEAKNIKNLLQDVKLKFPVCAKPCNLGSSVGIHKAKNSTELLTALLEIFKLDKEVMIEPFVENLVEYNVAVCKAFDNKIHLSAIEEPLKKDELLSFKDKYLSQGSIDNKLIVPAEGMASASRKLNPKLATAQKKFIEETAKKAFYLLSGTGAVRIDYLCNKKTGEIWLNEVNPIPGSMGYYLWEAVSPKIGFSQLLTALIEEGFREQKNNFNYKELKSFNASIFPTTT